MWIGRQGDTDLTATRFFLLLQKIDTITKSDRRFFFPSPTGQLRPPHSCLVCTVTVTFQARAEAAEAAEAAAEAERRKKGEGRFKIPPRTRYTHGHEAKKGELFLKKERRVHGPGPKWEEGGGGTKETAAYGIIGGHGRITNVKVCTYGLIAPGSKPNFFSSFGRHIFGGLCLTGRDRARYCRRRAESIRPHPRLCLLASPYPFLFPFPFSRIFLRENKKKGGKGKGACLGFICCSIFFCKGARPENSQ